MLKLSDMMIEGVVVEWYKKVGDKVKLGEVFVEIEIDKVIMEFEFFFDGILLYIGVEKGKFVFVNVLLVIIGQEGEDILGLIFGGGEVKVELVKLEVLKQDVLKQDVLKDEVLKQEEVF